MCVLYCTLSKFSVEIATFTPSWCNHQLTNKHRHCRQSPKGSFVIKWVSTRTNQPSHNEASSMTLGWLCDCRRKHQARGKKKPWWTDKNNETEKNSHSIAWWLVQYHQPAHVLQPFLRKYVYYWLFFKEGKCWYWSVTK